MKLSNKILLAFFGIAFFYLTAAFVEVRVRGVHNIMNDKNSLVETVELTNISYVVVDDVDKNVQIIGSDRPRLEVRSKAGDMLKNLTYKVTGDTLTLASLESGDFKMMKIAVYVPHSTLKGIEVKSSSATIEKLEQEVLQLSQHAARVWISDSKIADLRMELSGKSFVELNSSNLETITANIEGSQVMVSSPVGLVRGALKDDSFMQLFDIRDIQVTKDASSTLRMY